MTGRDVRLVVSVPRHVLKKMPNTAYRRPAAKSSGRRLNPDPFHSKEEPLQHVKSHMIQTLSRTKDKVLGFKLSGKLHDEDYKQFVPVVETAVKKYGKVRLLAQFEDFHGWDMHALWDDIKFATQQCTHVERIALVGEKTWENWMAKVCKPFTMAQVRYFDRGEIDAAWSWLEQTA